jgi:hypothetical protein
MFLRMMIVVDWTPVDFHSARSKNCGELIGQRGLAGGAAAVDPYS